MRNFAFIFTVLLAACAAPSDSNNSADADARPDASGGDTGRSTADAGARPDASGGDTGRSTSDTGVDATREGCAALGAADCVSDATCTLHETCVPASGDEEPFPGALGGIWEVTAESSEHEGLPSGSLEGSLSLVRVGDSALRGLVTFPEHEVSHKVWGGVGPEGALGLYFGPSECPGGGCDAPLEAAFTAGGSTTDEELLLDVVESAKDIQTFVSLHATPSDGFKPVFPIMERTDPFEARWQGGLMVASDSGEVSLLGCAIDVEESRGDYRLTSIACDEDGEPRIDEADAGSLAYADGRAWLALGPADDDLLLVGTVGVDEPWSGVVALRGDVWNDGDPAGPADVPVEDVRGTFEFSGVAQR